MMTPGQQQGKPIISLIETTRSPKVLRAISLWTQGEGGQRSGRPFKSRLSVQMATQAGTWKLRSNVNSRQAVNRLEEDRKNNFPLYPSEFL